LTDVKTIKQWLRVRNPDFRGFRDHEMSLHMMAGSEAFDHDPLELHDAYKFKRDATVWLQLVTYVLPAEGDSNSNDNNTDNNNSSSSPIPPLSAAEPQQVQQDQAQPAADPAEQQPAAEPAEQQPADISHIVLQLQGGGGESSQQENAEPVSRLSAGEVEAEVEESTEPVSRLSAG
jgi:hypothetical protein